MKWYKNLDGINKKFIVPFALIILCGIIMCILAALSIFSASFSQTSLYGVLAIGIITVIVTIAAFLICSRVVVKPLEKLNELTARVAEGDLDCRVLLNARDEIGLLSSNIDKIVSNLILIQTELESVSPDHLIREAEYSGGYKAIVSRINRLASDYSRTINNFSETLAKISDGSISKGTNIFAATEHKAINTFMENLCGIGDDIKRIADACAAGDINERLDINKYKGQWKSICLNVNNILNAFAEPLKETIDVVSEISDGNLGATIKGNYRGSYLELKNAVNSIALKASSCNNEISKTLDKLCEQDFDIMLASDYVGDYNLVKQSLNKVVETFNAILIKMRESSKDITSDAIVISQTSSSLSQGVSTQNETVETLNTSIQNISVKTKQNADMAENSNRLALAAKDSAELGNVEMTSMIEAMNKINEASGNISKIIKVIEDIALQTNLLALNAAVEAARAGAHGKGFSVVAEQVRTLAERSQSAAKESSRFIESSFEKVNNGVKIANATAQRLDDIVSQINEISDLISGVSKYSREQADSIEMVANGISSISDITRLNASLSQQSAVSSNALLKNSQMFEEMFSGFKGKSIIDKNNEPLAISKPVLADGSVQTPAKPASPISGRFKPEVAKQPVKTVPRPDVLPLKPTSSIKPFSAKPSTVKPFPAKQADSKPMVLNPAGKVNHESTIRPSSNITELKPKTQTQQQLVPTKNTPQNTVNIFDKKDFGKY